MEEIGLDDGCPQLALPALGSLLWQARAIPDLAAADLANRDLFEAIRALASTREGRITRAVGFKNLGSLQPPLRRLPRPAPRRPGHHSPRGPGRAPRGPHLHRPPPLLGAPRRGTGVDRSAGGTATMTATRPPCDEAHLAEDPALELLRDHLRSTYGAPE
jgi:hypothetical protein